MTNKDKNIEKDSNDNSEEILDFLMGKSDEDINNMVEDDETVNNKAKNSKENPKSSNQKSQNTKNSHKEETSNTNRPIKINRNKNKNGEKEVEQTSNTSNTEDMGNETNVDEDLISNLGSPVSDIKSDTEERKQKSKTSNVSDADKKKEENKARNTVNIDKNKSNAKSSNIENKETTSEDISKTEESSNNEWRTFREDNSKTNEELAMEVEDIQSNEEENTNDEYKDDRTNGASRSDKKKGIFSKLLGKNKDKTKSSSKSKANNKSTKISKKSNKSKKVKGKSNKGKDVKLNETDKIREESLTEEERNEIIEKRYRNMKLKKYITTTILLISLGLLLLFGVYNTFIKQEKSPQQLAYEVNRMNRDTAFPTAGVDGFLKRNINELIDDNVNLNKNTDNINIKPQDLYVTSIAKKSSKIANIYFTAQVETDNGINYHNFFMPMSYDYENHAYSPAGDVHITPVQPKDNIKEEDNEFLTFKDNKTMPEEETENAKSFIENFLTILYNEDGDVSPYYKGKESIGDPNAEFVSIGKFEYYASKNKNNYNVKVVYTLNLNEGFEYEVTNYIDLEKSGDSYIINRIL